MFFLFLTFYCSIGVLSPHPKTSQANPQGLQESSSLAFVKCWGFLNGFSFWYRTCFDGHCDNVFCFKSSCFLHVFPGLFYVLCVKSVHPNGSLFSAFWQTWESFWMFRLCFVFFPHPKFSTFLNDIVTSKNIFVNAVCAINRIKTLQMWSFSLHMFCKPKTKKRGVTEV